MTTTHIPHSELMDIDAKARVLRAQAIHYGTRAMATWVRSSVKALFTTKRISGNQTA